MSASSDRGDKNLDTSRALLTQAWTEQRIIKFFVAHVLFVGNPVTVLQYNAQHFSKRPSPRILWLRCLRRLDVTVGYANVRTCVTLWSVCSRTCQVTTCIRFFGQLDYDLCTIAVNLMLSLVVYPAGSPSCSPPARSDQFLVSSGSRPLLRPKWARFCLCQSTFYRGHSFTVAQLPPTFCVESPKSPSLHQCIVFQS